MEEKKGIMADLPAALEELQLEAIGLRKGLEEKEGAGGLGLRETSELLEQREWEADEVERKIKSMEAEVRRTGRERERREAEVKELEERRRALGREVREMSGGAGERRDGGDMDDLEQRGRWWRGLHKGVGGLLEMEVDA